MGTALTAAMWLFANPVSWVVVGAIVLLTIRTRVAARDVLRAYASAIGRRPAMAVLAIVVALHVAARIVIGIVAPGDFAGEIIAARSWSRGEGLYAPDLASESRLVADAPPDDAARWLAARLPSIVRARIDERRHGRIVAQAHPPALLAAFVPLVETLGPTGAFVLLAACTLAAGGWAAWRVAVTLGAPRDVAIGAALLGLGWQPVLASVRDGQVSVIVGSLAVAAWVHSRHDRWAAAGRALGTAASLKLYPVLLVIPLGLRSWRGAGVALAAMLVVAGIATAVAGPGAWPAYGAAAADAVRAHVTTPGNLSLLAWFGRVLPRPRAFACWAIAAAAACGVSAFAARVGREGELDRFDRTFAQYCCLAVVLAPVAWHHYGAILLLPLGIATRAAWDDGRRSDVLVVLVAALMLSLPVTDTRSTGIGGFAAMLVSPTTAILVLWADLFRRPSVACAAG